MLEEYNRKAGKRKKSKHSRKRQPEELDEEDFEVIKENFGLEVEKKKKSRLKRNADLEAE